MTKRLEEIEARLSAATPGPWERSDDGFIYRGLFCSGNHIAQTWSKLETDYSNAENNADLIANAPTDLRYLLDFAKAAREALEKIEDEACSAGHYSNGCDYGCKRIARATLALLERP
jgi:hypothetical protein